MLYLRNKAIIFLKLEFSDDNIYYESYTQTFKNY